MRLPCARRGGGLTFGRLPPIKKEAGQCSNTARPGQSPEFLSFREESSSLYPWRMVVPQGQAHLIAKMPIKENRKNGGQKSGQHVPQELHHRQSPPFGGLPHSSLIKIILSRQCGHERRAGQNHLPHSICRSPDCCMRPKANSGNMRALRAVDFRGFLSTLAERGRSRHTLRIVVKFWAGWSLRERLSSSSKTTSGTWCSLFSISQCARMVSPCRRAFRL